MLNDKLVAYAVNIAHELDNPLLNM